jgi:nucleoside-diphosphate-sugar epimerase
MVDIQQERFLVTGAGGFVGACLVRRLVSIGANVHALCHQGSDLWRLKDISDKLNIHWGDIQDKAFVCQLIQQVQPSVIYHLAAYGAYPFQQDAFKMVMTNLVGTLNLMEALHAVPYKVLVNTGSSSEYGFKDTAMAEEDKIEPNSYYAVTKAAQTLLCQYLAKEKHQPIVTFRLFSIYGPWEEPTRLMPTIIKRALKHEPLQMVSPNTTRDFVYIEDVINAYLMIQPLSEQRGKVLNIASGLESSLSVVVDKVLRLTSSRSEVLWGAMDQRSWDAKHWQGNPALAKQLIGWEAKYDLERGIQEMIDWIKVYG